MVRYIIITAVLLTDKNGSSCDKVTENEDIVIAITPEEPINEKSAKVKYQMSEEER